jgi:3-isopropylmalate/(R)-2-methylmalate dehydratase small subunit
MEAMRIVKGIAAPLTQDNINTDAILPSTQILSVESKDLGRRLFFNWRYDGTLDAPKPGFILNRPPYDHAKIIVAGENFGCGSSREMAVWALKQFGIDCIIAPSFGTIFRANCVQNSVLPVALPVDAVKEIATLATSATPGAIFEVDLERGSIDLPDGRQFHFIMDEDERETLLEGLDAIDRTLKYQANIDAFRKHDKLNRPWIYTTHN